MKLSGDAAGVRAVGNRCRAGTIEGACPDDSGRVAVSNPQHATTSKVAVRVRISAREQEEVLGRQAQRMKRFASAVGLSVVTVVRKSPQGERYRSRLAALREDNSRDTLAAGHEGHSFAARLDGLRSAHRRAGQLIAAVTGPGG